MQAVCSLARAVQLDFGDSITHWNRPVTRLLLPRLADVQTNCMASLIGVVAGDAVGTLVTSTRGTSIDRLAILSFLGIGLQPLNPSRGAMLYRYCGYWRTPLWPLPFMPAGALVAIKLAFNFLGDGLNDALNPQVT
jgi:hypothetical protein